MKQDTDFEIASPEEVHKFLHVLHPRSWLSIYFMAAIAAGVVGFLLFGRIPMTGHGNGMIIARGTVRTVQATSDGQISKWHVRVGDTVEQGQLLVTVKQPMAEKDLEQAREQLVAVKSRNQKMGTLTSAANEKEREVAVQKKETLEARIKELEEQIAEARTLTKETHDAKMKVLGQRQRKLGKLKRENAKRKKEVQAKLKRTTALLKKKLATADQEMRAREAVSQAQTRLSEVNVQVMELDIEFTRARQNLLDATNRLATREDALAQLRSQLNAQTLRLAQIDQQESSTDKGRELQESDIKRTIARYESQLKKDQHIRSEYTGRVLELTASEGQVISQGFRLGAIDTNQGDVALEAVGYFKLSDGKKIEPGMRMRLTPATVEQTRFGSVMATVTSVSPHAVTAEGAAVVAGNQALGRALTADSHQIEVVAELARDSDGKLVWDTSDGPAFEVTSGTKAKAMVHIRERPPLTFIIPILADWEGL